MFLSVRSSLVLAFSLAALAAAPAMASSAYHPQNNEAGATFHPDHVAGRSRDQVSAELANAMKNPAWQPLVSRGAPWPSVDTGVSRSRGQVQAELNKAMTDPAWQLVSRGAPWPSNGMSANQLTPK